MALGHSVEQVGAHDRMSNNGSMTSQIGLIIHPQIIYYTGDYSTGRNMFLRILMVVEGRFEQIFGWYITMQIE